MRENFQITKLADDTYVINECIFSMCYLLVGTEKAMLIDTSLGVKGLKEAVEKITKLPLIVVATHGHVDHVGGCPEFGQAYLPEADLKEATTHTGSLIKKVYMAVQPGKYVFGIKNSDLVNGHVDYTLYGDGQEWDLGGRTVKAFLTPGHTVGSSVLRDSKTNFLFSGDITSLGVFMWLPNRTTIAEYRKTLDKLTTIVNESGKLYWGHSEKPLKPQGVDKLKNCCDKILKQDNSKIPKIKIAFSDGLFNKRMIIYGTKKIK